MNITTTLKIPQRHPMFQGHFPGRPIVPGVVLLDEVLRLIEQERRVSLEGCMITRAKFRSVVSPGQLLTVHCETRADGSIQFTIRASDAVVADGLISIPCPTGPPGNGT